MPAIQVARTDTFEAQRQKINEIGSQIFSITQGGSDLATGNLKIGDGTRTAPSLAFASDDTLGIYKSDTSTIGYVSSGRKIADFAPAAFYSFRDLVIQRKTLSSSALSIQNFGSGYDAGTYQNVPLFGGTGEGAAATIIVDSFSGVVSQAGKNYIPGPYVNISLEGGSGTNTVVSFTVDDISGEILNAGSGYVPGTYQNVPLTGGSGSGAEATLTITGTTTLSGSITNNGSGYATGFFSPVTLLNTPTQTFTVTAIANPGSPPPDNVFQIDGNTQPTLTLIKGNTYRFDLSDASVASHPLDFQTSLQGQLDNNVYIVVRVGSQGSAGAFLDLIILPSAPTETITYICTAHSGMGGNIDVVTGSAGQYGYGATGSITVDGSGLVQDLSFLNSGSLYKQNDILQLPTNYGGTGFEFTLSTPTYTGEVINVVITEQGSDYLNNDVLSVNNSSIGGFGSGFQFSISSNPGQVIDLAFTSKGSNYQVSDVLTLPEKIENISSFVLDSSTSVTLPQSIPVTGIIQGSTVAKVSGTGEFAADTSIVSTDIATNSIVLSDLPTTSGSIDFNIVPPYGDITLSTDIFKYEIQSLGSVSSFTITSSGNGYSANDTLTINPSSLTQPIQYSTEARLLLEVDFSNTYPSGTFSVGDTLKLKDGSILTVNLTSIPSVTPTTVSGLTTTLDQFNATIVVSSTTGITSGMIVQQVGGNGALTPGTTVLSVDSATEITLSQLPVTSGSATLDFSTDESGTYTSVSSTTSGNGSGATFDIIRSSNGAVSSVSVNESGYFYQENDTVTISGSLVGGSSPAEDIVLEVASSLEENALEIYEIRESGGNISSLIIDNDSMSAGDILISTLSNSPEYTLNSVSSAKNRFFIDTGSGPAYIPSFTLYVGNKYNFDTSDTSLVSVPFALSSFPDGRYSPSLIENVSTTLDVTSTTITVSSTTGILPGMGITVESGSGSLAANTLVESVDSATEITLSSVPLASGNVSLKFEGVEYTQGVSKSASSLEISVSNLTPSQLYYYCSSTINDNNADAGGEDGVEAIVTIDPNNPKVFGSGFEVIATAIDSVDVVTGRVDNGELQCETIISEDGQIDALSSTTINSVLSVSTSTLTCSSITSPSSSLLVSPQTVNFAGNLAVGSTITVAQSTGNITTTGVLKTTNSVNVNDYLLISNNNISSTSGNNIVLSPFVGQVVKVNTNTALTIPSGNTAQRPAVGTVENGSIRFNTETGQYEGYSAATTSWSSLGGVRDLDGNTYIAAEASVGANDNILYFFNDGNNTVSVTPNYLQFVNVKKVRSVNTTAPVYTDYTTNTQVTLGQYLKYRNNIYEVTIAGQTGTSGNEPTHTTGAASNGTAELTWYASAVAPLTFEEIEEVRIDPLGFTDLVVNAELRFSNNVISTDLNDLIIRPNTGKKITLDATSSLVVPVGDSNQRGVAAQGSIRYNTTISQYEGYDGSNWTSLGGVKDVDGNTYIIPELSPGSNENILYFYNDGVNTMRLSTNSLEFTNIDAITSQNNNLDIEAQTVTFNSLAATIDTSGTSTFISTTKDNLDLGLAVGLNVDPLLRLDINGDIYLNRAFGTGSFDGLKLFNSDLSTFELSDFAFTSDDIALIKGGTNSGASVLYDPSTQSGARVTVSVVNQTTGDKEMIEYQVIDKGSDIFHTDIGNLKTGNDLVTSVFDFDANNNVRVTFTLDTNMTVGDVVNITVVKHIFKN